MIWSTPFMTEEYAAAVDEARRVRREFEAMPVSLELSPREAVRLLHHLIGLRLDRYIDDLQTVEDRLAALISKKQETAEVK